MKIRKHPSGVIIGRHQITWGVTRSTRYFFFKIQSNMTMKEEHEYLYRTIEASNGRAERWKQRYNTVKTELNKLQELNKEN